jgi:iron-sulfur cluster assembly protein
VLTLTAPAVEAIRNLTAQPGMQEESGLRITHEDTSGGLELSISAGPEDGDQVIETAGVRVFLQTTAVRMLEGKALDAHVNEEGVIFRIDSTEPAESGK